MFNLSGGLVELLRPGQSLVCLLRPTHWDLGAARLLTPGEYQARIHYHGPTHGALKVIKRYWPDQPASSFWTGDVASGQVSFTIVDNPENRRPQLVWGPPVNGLQAAAEYADPTARVRREAASAAFRYGTGLRVRFHVKNVSNKSISLWSETWRQGDKLFLIDASGGETRVGGNWYTGWTTYEHWTLHPGQVAVLGASDIGIAENEQAREKFSHPIGKVVVAKAGQYRLRHELSFGNWRRSLEDGQSIPSKDDWQGSLSTGATAITVGPRPKKEPAKPTQRGAAVETQRDGRAARTMSISGTCEDGENKPLPDVQVELYRVENGLKPERLQETRTNAHGHFGFEGLASFPKNIEEMPAWYYTIVATKKGRASNIYSVYPANAGDRFVFPMPKAAALQGRVTDSSGKPVAGALVFSGSLPTGDPLVGVQCARSDADGRYVINDLHPVKATVSKSDLNGKTGVVFFCYLTVRHPDYGERRPTYQSLPATIDVMLPPAGIVEGRIVDEVTGTPAANVNVCCQGADNSVEGSGWHQTRTGQDGRYQLGALLAGKYNVWAEKSDRACKALDSFVVEAGTKYHLPDLKLIEGSWIEGKIVEAGTGKPYRRVEKEPPLYVGLYGPSRPKSGPACQSAAVDDQGTFHLRVAPGVNFPYIQVGDIWERTQRRDFYEKGIDVKPGEIAEVVFRVLREKPPLDLPPAVVRLSMPVPAEREAAERIRQLGGWYRVNDENHVIEVNMVYHETPEKVRFDNDRTESDEALRQVGAFPRLRELLLCKGQATDDGLKAITRLKELEKVLIWDAEHITDAGALNFAGLKKLNYVQLSNAQIGDATLAVLAQSPSLTGLSLQGNSFTDAGLKHLAGKRQFRILWVSARKQRFTDAGMRQLAGLKELQVLGIDNLAISDEGVAALKDLTDLRQLYLQFNKASGTKSISDTSLTYLLNFKKLQRLGIGQTRITEGGIKKLIGLPNLRDLSLSSALLSNDSIDRLKRLRPDLRLSLGSATGE
jgi:5-hydroxyisourate hydrolase-like protein (transthyretin family)